jgi:periplasmic divalent cation tolerance protein
MYQLLFSTCPDQDSARRIAHLLVAQKLAACVNIVPGLTSVYQWQGEIHEDQEVLLLIKSRLDLYAALEAALKQAHPYQTPELIACPISVGLPAYLNWISQVTA